MLRKLTILCLLLIVSGRCAFAAPSFDFVVIQPGQPGTSADAQPVMDALGAYLQDKLGAGVTVRGRYFNQAEEAATYLADNQPSWGIVSLGYFLSQADALCLTPLAATRPGGSEDDTWRLLTAADGPATWNAVEGTVAGTMLFEPEVAARLMFGTTAEKLPFRLEGTARPLRAVRGVLRGNGGGVLLDAPQHEAMRALPTMAGLKVVATSQPLPTAAVVAFGAPGARHEKLREILMAMGRDPAAGDLLQLLQTEGFGPADARLDVLRENGI